ncbi:MAG: response regulator transcription factor [Salinivirgaceae bacterium]|nr:response regulator transcription factor [Salinivirgaceae bacterium]
MPKSKINIIVVDDNQAFLQSVGFLLMKNNNYTIIKMEANGEQVLKNKNLNKTDIILMDIEMPKLDGIETTKRLLKNISTIKIIALTNHFEKAYTPKLINAGFMGCIYKKNTFDQIDDAIQAVMKGYLYFPEESFC